MSLRYWSPSVCRKCKGLFVNWLGAELSWMLLWMAGGVVLGLTMGAHSPEPPMALILVATVLVVIPSRALFVKPIRYKDFKPYGARSWEANVVLFGIIPLALVAGAVFLAMFFNLGK